MDGRAEFCGLACGTHARNIRRSSAPYSYGLAARARRIYNDVACSGGQGGRSSLRTQPLEATRPGLLGTPGLVYSLSQRPIRLRRSTRFIGTVISEKRKRRTAVIGPACRRSQRSEKLPDDRPRHDHEHDMDDLADDPADRASGLARLKAMVIWSPRARFQIHLKFAFCSDGGISVC